MKRVLIASMMHESNSFNPIVAGEKDFKVIRGEEILKLPRSNSSLSGIMETLRARGGYELVPTVSVSAVPNGMVDYDFYMARKAEILQIAREEKEKGPIDAITMALHGSMHIKGLGDAEGYLLEELRELFPDIPIFVALDMHTTMTHRMHDNCDGFVGYKCAPHTDRFETGVNAANMTIAALEEGVKAHSVWVKVPILIAGEQSSTTVEPMKHLTDLLREAEKQDGILAASYLMGFPWCDNENSSVSVNVVAKTQELAESEALRLAQIMWDTRHDFCFQTETYPEQEALDVAFEAVEKGEPTPVYLSDSGDNPTAGSSGDCTGFLSRILADSRTDKLRNPVLFACIYDPEAARACVGNVGKELTLTFGAKFDRKTTAPVTATGTVISCIEKWERSSAPGVLAMFRTQGVDLILSESHVGCGDPHIFSDLGRDPADADIVVCKLGYLTNEQSLVAKRSIMALSKGSTNEDLKTLPYEKIPRPIFPLDDNFAYDVRENLIPKAK